MSPKSSEKNKRARVLLVDDKPENLRLLAEMLTERGYTIQVARSGEQALKAADERLPDIVLLDINMPGTDGFEVCRRLKAKRATREIPVMFVTALAKTAEKVRGLELGGVDYVTKPFQLEEVAARLETQLELKRLRDDLAEKVSDLEDRNSRLNLFAKALAHDLRGPLGIVLGFSDLLLTSEDLSDQQRHQLEFVHQGSQKMSDITESLLILAVTDRSRDHLCPTNVEDSFNSALEGLSEMARESGARIELKSSLPTAMGNSSWLERVWTNFLSNAIKYGGEPPLVSAGAEETDHGVIRYWVEDNGAGLDAEQKTQLFTAFNRLDPEKAEGIGLGLVIVQKIVQQMGGEVGVEDGNTGGSRFYFTLPTGRVEDEPGDLSDRHIDSRGDNVVLAR